MITAQEALELLREGNKRFVSDACNFNVKLSHERLKDLVAKQQPYAIILGCSDSRVPPEIVFDQGLGDLFVIRVAGNVVASTQLGSIEFAVARLGIRLVVVLGHSQCGAVQVTLETIQKPQGELSCNIRSIVDRVQPSVDELMKPELDNDFDSLYQQAVRANVRASVNDLRNGSEVLKQMIKKEDLVVVGAEYSLETGVVEFFDDG